MFSFIIWSFIFSYSTSFQLHLVRIISSFYETITRYIWDLGIIFIFNLNKKDIIILGQLY